MPCWKLYRLPSRAKAPSLPSTCIGVGEDAVLGRFTPNKFRLLLPWPSGMGWTKLDTRPATPSTPKEELILPSRGAVLEALKATSLLLAS